MIRVSLVLWKFHGFSVVFHGNHIFMSNSGAKHCQAPRGGGVPASGIEFPSVLVAGGDENGDFQGN